MSKIVLTSNFSKENWIDYFDSHSSYFRSADSIIRQHQNENFPSVALLGTMDLTGNDQVSVYLIQTCKPLSERSYRKQQYDLAVDILKETHSQAALCVFHDDENAFRLSLVYPIYHGTKKDFSTYKRFSYFISADTPHHTYEQQLGTARLDSLKAIKECFAVEPVTSEFFVEVSLKFLELVGGERKIGTKTLKYPGSLVLPSLNSEVKKEFAVRLDRKSVV